MITADRPTTHRFASADDDADAIFDLDRPSDAGPARGRAVTVGAAALAIVAAIALVALVVRHDDAAVSTPPTASFALIEPALLSPTAETVPTEVVVSAGGSRYIVAPHQRVRETRTVDGDDAQTPDTEFVVRPPRVINIALIDGRSNGVDVIGTRVAAERLVPTERYRIGRLVTADGSGSIWTRDDVEITIAILAEFG